jgi:integrase
LTLIPQDCCSIVYPSGIRSFFHYRSVRGYPKRTSIGQFPEISVEQARGRASALNADLSKWRLNDFRGDGPFEKKRDPTLNDIATEYIQKHILLQSSRPEKAAKNATWQLTKYFGQWRKRKIGSIRKKDVRNFHDDLKASVGPHTANRAIEFLRAVFNWAIDEAEIWQGENPARKIKLFHEAERERIVEKEELPRFFLELRRETNIDLRDFVNLAMWTGARRGDIFSMRWENLALADNRWTVPDPKTVDPYQVALTPEAIAILRDRKQIVGDSPWVFPSRGRTGHIVDLKTAWHKLLVRANLTNLRIHDLRRTLGSYQAAQGTSMKIIGESLGHKSLASTQPYAQLNLDPIRASVMKATRTIIAASKNNPKLARARKPKLLEAGKP